MKNIVQKWTTKLRITCLLFLNQFHEKINKGKQIMGLIARIQQANDIGYYLQNFLIVIRYINRMRVCLYSS